MKKILITLLSLFMLHTAYSQSQVMTSQTLWKLGRVSLGGVSNDGSTIVYSVSRYDVDANSGKTQLYSVSIDGTKTQQLTYEDKSSSFVGFVGAKIAYLQGAQLWMMNSNGSDKTKVSDIEDGIDNVKFSTDGSSVLFTKAVKVSQSTADRYPELPKANAMIFDDLLYRHWNQWVGESVSHVFFAPFDGKNVGEITDIMKGEAYNSPLMPMGGSEQLNWSPDGKKIAYTAKKKTGAQAALSTDSNIYIYDITTGETTNLTEDNKGYDTNPAWSPNGNRIAWTAMKTDGYEADKNDIIIYDFALDKKYNMTEKWDETIEEFQWHPRENKIVFRAAINAVEQLFELRLGKALEQVKPSTDIVQLTQDKNSKGVFVVTPKNIVTTRVNYNRPNEIFSFDLKKRTVKQLTDVNAEIFKDIKPSEVKERWTTSSDGKRMLSWVIYPPDFDPTKKYPTLLFCGGGPQSVIAPSYSFRWNFQLMAAQGYIVIAPNRRGLPSFGTKWNEQVSGDWGGQSITDLYTAIDDLAKESYVDKEHLGAVGASYGGYSVFMLAGGHQGRFKTFISHCGTFDNRSWYGSTEELFFATKELDGPYWDNYKSTSYNEFSPSNYVDKWDTPILILQGALDFRVPENQAMQAFTAARVRGIDSRLVLFPEEGHWVVKPQNSLLWQNEFFSWLAKYLK